MIQARGWVKHCTKVKERQEFNGKQCEKSAKYCSQFYDPLIFSAHNVAYIICSRRSWLNCKRSVGLTLQKSFIRGLDSLCKAYTVVSEVELSVIATDENISQNPQGAGRHIDSEESTDALALSHNGHLKDKQKRN